MADKKIEPALVAVGAYLQTNDTFVIPEYQRPYAWGIPVCDKLFSDVDDYLTLDEAPHGGAVDQYFFGSVIIDCSTSGELQLIDGQQRTTTFLLLLSALKLRLLDALEATRGDEEARTLHKAIERHLETVVQIMYRAGEEAWQFLEDTSRFEGAAVAFENRSVNENADFFGDLSKIIEARSYAELERAVFRAPRRKGDNKYSPHFRNFKYFYEKFDDRERRGPSYVKRFADTLLNHSQVIVIRSWNFSQAINMFNSLNSDGQPLTDADIISAQVFRHEGGSDAQNLAWRNLVTSVEELPDAYRFDITDILNQYMYIDRARNGITDLTVQGLRTFYTRTGGKREYTNPDLLRRDPAGFVASLQALVDDWSLAADCPGMAQLLRLNYNARYFIATFMQREGLDLKSEDGMRQLRQLVDQLLRLFLVLEAYDWGYSSSYFKGFLFPQNVRLADASVPIAEFARDLTDHLERSNFTPEGFRERLDGYRSYAIVHVNEYLLDPDKAPRVGAEIQVEHVMPQSGRNIEVIRHDANLDDIDEFTDYVNRLGNLMMLEASINTVIGNSWFASKLAGYRRSGYGSAAEILNAGPASVDDDHRTWTRIDIDNRTRSIIDRVSDFVFDQ